MSIFMRSVASLAPYFPFLMFSNSLKDSAIGLEVRMYTCEVQVRANIGWVHNGRY